MSLFIKALSDGSGVEAVHKSLTVPYDPSKTAFIGRNISTGITSETIPRQLLTFTTFSNRQRRLRSPINSSAATQFVATIVIKPGDDNEPNNEYSTMVALNNRPWNALDKFVDTAQESRDLAALSAEKSRTVLLKIGDVINIRPPSLTPTAANTKYEFNYEVCVPEGGGEGDRFDAETQCFEVNSESQNCGSSSRNNNNNKRYEEDEAARAAANKATQEAAIAAAVAAALAEAAMKAVAATKATTDSANKILISMYECTMCFDIIHKHHTGSNCYHTFCKVCLEKHKSNNKVKPVCPICGVELGELRKNGNDDQKLEALMKTGVFDSEDAEVYYEKVRLDEGRELGNRNETVIPAPPVLLPVAAAVPAPAPVAGGGGGSGSGSGLIRFARALKRPAAAASSSSSSAAEVVDLSASNGSDGGGGGRKQVRQAAGDDGIIDLTFD